MTPKVSRIRQDDTHRLIPSRYGDRTTWARLTESEEEREEISELDSITDEHVLGEAGLLPGISVHELLFGVAYGAVVNAAFTHARPGGSRFSSEDRGAWYAAFELKTAQAEVAFHRSQDLKEINWREPETFQFRDFLADFRAGFHDVRGDKAWVKCLDANSYFQSQKLARELLSTGSAGIVYPSVRRPKGTCIVCFRPALVSNVREGRIVVMTFHDAQSPPIIVQH